MKKTVIYAAIALSTMACMPSEAEIDAQVEKEMQKVEDKVNSDAENAYNIALKNGDAMSAHIQASGLSQSYLQAGDEENYKKWKAVEDSLSKELGMDFGQ